EAAREGRTHGHVGETLGEDSLLQRGTELSLGAGVVGPGRTRGGKPPVADGLDRRVSRLDDGPVRGRKAANVLQERASRKVTIVAGGQELAESQAIHLRPLVAAEQGGDLAGQPHSLSLVAPVQRLLAIAVA